MHANAVNAVCLFSLVVSLLGRTVLGWLANMSSVGTGIALAYVSACAWKTARRDGRTLRAACGVVGMVLSACLVLLLVVPIPGLGDTLSVESYVFLITWVVLGVNYYTPVSSRSSKNA